MKKCIAVLLLLISIINAIGQTNSVKTDKRKPEVLPETVAINYIKWYIHNQDRLAKFPLVTGGLPDHSSKNYSVNFQATEQYLKELKSSGYVSEKYLDNFRAYFRKCNEYLKNHLQKDGPAYGFEADLVLQVQDYSDIVEDIDKASLVSKKVTSNTATIKLGISSFIELYFSLTNHNNVWLIDSYKTHFKTMQ